MSSVVMSMSRLSCVRDVSPVVMCMSHVCHVQVQCWLYTLDICRSFVAFVKCMSCASRVTASIVKKTHLEG